MSKLRVALGRASRYPDPRLPVELALERRASGTPPVLVASVWTCGECRSRLERGYAFCGSCGTRAAWPHGA